MRHSFRGWRGQRSFWGGLLSILGGIPIMYFPYANLTLGSMTIRMATTAGAGSLIIGVLLVVLGLTMWFQPHSRVFAGVAAILLALVSWWSPTSVASSSASCSPCSAVPSASPGRRAGRRPRQPLPAVTGPGRTTPLRCAADRGRHLPGRGRKRRRVRDEPGQRDEREAPCRLTRCTTRTP